MKRIRESLSGEKGFTLVELLVVIGIIGILAMMLLPQFRGMRDRARIASCQSNLKNIGTTLEAYYADNERYPANAATFYGLFGGADAASVTDKVCLCPHSRAAYTYTPTTVGGRTDAFVVTCGFHNGAGGATNSTTAIRVTEKGVERQEGAFAAASP